MSTHGIAHDVSLVSDTVWITTVVLYCLLTIIRSMKLQIQIKKYDYRKNTQKFDLRNYGYRTYSTQKVRNIVYQSVLLYS